MIASVAVSMTAMLPLPALSWETQAVVPVLSSATATGCFSPEIVEVTVLVAVEIDRDLVLVSDGDVDGRAVRGNRHPLETVLDGGDRNAGGDLARSPC